MTANGSSGDSGSGSIFPRFVSDRPSDGGAIMNGLGFSTLNGLPAFNSAFGGRSITHSVLVPSIGSADIEVFYATFMRTHPADGTVKWCSESTAQVSDPSAHLKLDNVLEDGLAATSNWFFYYSQAYEAPCPIAYTAYYGNSYNSA